MASTLSLEIEKRRRLPTLFEVLSRYTLAPVDLFSFYIYMRDQQRSVDYLDFWYVSGPISRSLVPVLTIIGSMSRNTCLFADTTSESYDDLYLLRPQKVVVDHRLPS